ncbi:flagellar biosynthesis protein FlhB [Porticoccaceae bacterium]|jgi:flagellar biosynthetic protein FlhB|nr:flagellar biosynthesis protein FlhB [Porticoccaceae bacterium]MDB4108932.1 flagellar biosynthesis protein FlhB [Porticoccaceae bacterium]MDB9843064.1 flagellar biosynthesis protein FlhB [Porticoccaceae bacterium]MDC1477420.1 flagellar biosynthesis protein FlhB [Porticoccaceae bacterium]CAI8312064.1 MAG: Flagellar biosynthetic protein FlhB [SAR92 bacterium MED-G29]|tara:strand:+ start:6138 stop:7286 length:1149 start_codon:yes stop_codon:yes gene_type:complete
MADQDTSEERTEEPTAKKLEKAREDGQVVRSQELSVAAMMIGIASFMYIFGGAMVVQLSQVFAAGFTFDRKIVFSENLLPAAFGSQAMSGLFVAVPIFALAVVIAFIAAGMLGGFNFSMKALAPKASKINPLSGLKRIFGTKALVDLSKAIVKFSLVGAVLYLVVSSQFEQLIGIGFMDIKPAMNKAGDIIAGGAVLVTLTLIIAAAIDVPYQLYEHSQKMKMTKQEVKDEFKDTEGRPEVKAQIRRKQREMAMGQMMDAVGSADVIIVNPEHFAVALSYDPSSSGAPTVVAKGVDFLARGIRERAGDNAVPVFLSPTLARALYFTTDVNQSIPESLYYAVAQVIAYVFSLNSLGRGAAVAEKPNPEVPQGMRYNTDGTLAE